MQGSARQYFANIKDAIRSFWHGLSITLSYMARRPITVQYPDRVEKPVREMLPERYRGLLEVDMAVCTACTNCEKACPVGCIKITVDKDPANPKQRVISQFDIDEARCMFCGLCVEPCTYGAIQHTREFEGAQRHVENLVIRWIDDPTKPVPVYRPVKGQEAVRAPVGSLLRKKMEQMAWNRERPELPTEDDSADGPAAAAAGGEEKK